MNDLPNFITFLITSLNCSLLRVIQESELRIFIFDLSQWRLDFSSYTPIIEISAQHSSKIDGETLLDLARDTHILGLGIRKSILLLSDNQTKFFQLSQELPWQFALLNSDDQQRIMKSPKPISELATIFREQRSLHWLLPYSVSGPVTDSRFFGRAREVKRVLETSNINIAVTGVRRIGKTSLLREAQRQLSTQESSNPNRIVYLDGAEFESEAEVVRETVRMLDPRELYRLSLQEYPWYFPDFLRRMAKRNHAPIMFLIDEFDSLLEIIADSRTMHEGPLLNAFRAGSNQDFCHFVVAGGHQLRRAMTNIDSPLYNFMSPIYLSAFSLSDTRELIVTPLENAGITILQPTEFVTLIHNSTGGLPNYIQYVCQALVAHLENTGGANLAPDDLSYLLEDQSLNNFVLGSFYENLSNFEKIVILIPILYAIERDFSLPEIDARLRELEVVVPLDQYISATETLSSYGILYRKGTRYSFSVQLMADVLRRNVDIEFMLMGLIKETAGQ